jgi:predicted AlkP superfamily phosphohydrolase/phosphomutase
MRIPVEQQILGIVFSLILLIGTIQLVRKHKLREEYALVWLAASFTIFVLTIFDPLVGFLASVFVVTYPPTLILVFGLLFCLLVMLSQSVMLSEQADRIRDLAQNLGIMEWRLHQIEKLRTHEGAENRPRAHDLPVNGDAPPVAAAAIEQAPTHPVHRETEMLTPSETAVHAFERSRHSASPTPTLPRAAVAKPDKPNKVLVIGLDGATFDLIKPWVEAGHLPTLGKLMREGAHGELRSTVPPMTGPAWTSFATGVNPGKHRLYDWIARDEGSYRFSPVTALDCEAPTLYSLLSQAGRRVCALNVPMTYPPTPVNGVMVSGMPAPSTNVTITYPKTLYQEIIDAVGDYILYPDPGQAYSDSGIDAFLARLYKTTDLRVRTLNYLRSREDWDFAMVVFNGTDTISHALWKYMDTSHPLYDPAKGAKYGHAIRDYYAYVDGKLAAIVDSLPSDTTLVIMSDHGFGPFHKFIHVNNWLMEGGFMQVQRGLRSRTKYELFRRGLSPMNVYDKLMRLGLGALKREVVRGQGQGLLKTFFLSFEDIDWSRTQAYSLGNVGQIYLNVIGREPQGCVRPGAEYERVRDRIMAQLWTLRDPETGEAVVEQVYRREELYQGEYLGHAPDIVFLPKRLEYFGFGEYEFGSHKVVESMRRGISGTHRMNGIFMAYGAAVTPGATVENASLYDLAPTIMQLMGEPVMAHMDGRILAEVLAENVEARMQEMQLARPVEAYTGSGQKLSAEDKLILSERLRNLGYVG